MQVRLKNVETVQIFPLAHFIWLYHIYAAEVLFFLPQNLSSLGHSHTGLVFINEEHEKSWLMV